jgi:Glycosyl hydrolase catalytic core
MWIAAGGGLVVLLAIIAVILALNPRVGTEDPAAIAGTPEKTVTPSATPDATPGTSTKRPTTSTPALPEPGRRSAKKGVSTRNISGAATALAAVNASWYYNWDARPTNGAGASAEFVPMIWGPDSVTPGNLARAKSSGRTLLGFNEPDFDSQANMTVEQALDLWPQLQATGMRLGSPAPAVGAATAGRWLDRFMTGAHDRGYRVDFVALHWYGADFSDAAVGQLQSYLRAVHDRYGRPIWLTEFALLRWDSSGQPIYPSTADQTRFISRALAMLGGLSYVERYAWYALPTPAGGGLGTGLYQPGHGLTAAGTAFRAAG